MRCVLTDLPIPRPCHDARRELRAWHVGSGVVDRIASRFDLTVDQPVVDRYLVTAFADVNVKVRDDEVQVKRRLDATAGFERWCPLWARTGALAPVDAGRLLGFLGAESARDDLPSTVGELSEFARRSDEIVVVEVTKHRRQGERNGVTAEVTRLQRGPDETTTVAIEGLDIDALREVRHDLGLERVDNVPMNVGVVGDWNGKV